MPKEAALKLAQVMTPELFHRGTTGIASRVTSDSNLVTLKHNIANSFTINDKNGIPALYVINYAADSGFIVISADFRYEPICAMGESGGILQTDTIPSMLGSWFGRTVENIQFLRDGSYDNGAAAGLEWQRWNAVAQMYVNTSHSFPPPPDPCAIPITPVTVYPLLGAIRWGQSCTYNESCPAASCSGCNVHVQTGCVATAMAQVIRYWYHPESHNYNYASMPFDHGNAEVQRLMHDAGVSVNTNYGCSQSGAGATFWNHLLGTGVVNVALKNTFDLASADHHVGYQSADKWTIIGNLNAAEPVILGGFPSESHFLFWTWGTGSGHEWVCDGYQLNGTQCYKDVWFHMNWGWHEYQYPYDYSGWYYWDDWSPIPSLGYQYNYAQTFEYNIHS